MKCDTIMNGKTRTIICRHSKKEGIDYTVNVTLAGNVKDLKGLGIIPALYSCNLVPIPYNECTEGKGVELGFKYPKQEIPNSVLTRKDCTFILGITPKQVRLHMHPDLEIGSSRSELLLSAGIIFDHAVTYVENKESYYVRH
jgi:hypothetical protein